MLTICCRLHGCDIYLHSGNTGKQLSLKTLAFECNLIVRACNLKKDWVLTICCGLHGCDIYLHSGNTGKQLSLKTLAFECNSIEYDIVICDYAINIPVPQSRCCHRLHVSHANASCRGRTLLPQCKHASLSFSRAPFSEAIFSLSILT